MLDWLKELGLENTQLNKLILSAAIIIVAVVIWRLVHLSVKRMHKKRGRDGRLSGTAGTAVALVYSIARGVLIIFVLLWVLQINGVNVSSLFAGLGIAGAIVGLAFQDLLRDLIMGIRIVADDFFKVGDVIEYGGEQGQVVDFNLRCTKIRTLHDGSILTISNRNISDMKKMSHLILLNIPLAYEADYRKVHEVLRDIAARIARVDDVERCEYKGTQSFDSSAIIYRINLYCAPERKWHCWREAHRILQEGLDEAELHIPYQQIDVHNIPAK